MSKKFSAFSGLVYSTNPDAMREDPSESTPTPEAGAQKLRVRLDTKRRAGKVITLVENFIGSASDLTALGKQLKIKCGSGGSVKDGEILIQGDYKEKITQWLRTWGYQVRS
jgi:translation initiation factor 1